MKMTVEWRGRPIIILIATYLIEVFLGCYMYSVGYFHLALLQIYSDGDVITGLVGILNLTLLSFLGPFASMFMNRFTARIAIVCGGVLISSGCLLSAFIPHIMGTVVCFGIVAGVGNSVAGIPLFIAPGYYFTKHREFVACTIQLFLAIGMVISTPVAAYLVDEYGVRGAYLIYSGCALHFCIVGLLFKPTQLEMEIMQKHRARNGKAKSDLEDLKQEQEIQEYENVTHDQHHDNIIRCHQQDKVTKHGAINGNVNSDVDNLEEQNSEGQDPKIVIKSHHQNITKGQCSDKVRKCQLPTTVTQCQHPDVTKRQHPDNVTKGQHPDNVTKGQHPDNVTKGQHPDNVAKSHHPDNVTKGQRPDSVTKGQRPDNVTEGQRPDNVTKGQHPENVTKGQRPDNVTKGQITKCHPLLNPSYILFLVGTVSWNYVFGIVQLNLPSYLNVTGKRLDTDTVMMLFGIGNAVGKLAAALVSLKMWIKAIDVYIMSLLFLGAVFVAFPWYSEFALSCHCLAFVSGLASGASQAVIPSVILSILEIEWLSTGFGIGYFFCGLGAFCGPNIASVMANGYGSYDAMFVFTGIICLAGCVCSVLARILINGRQTCTGLCWKRLCVNEVKIQTELTELSSNVQEIKVNDAFSPD